MPKLNYKSYINSVKWKETRKDFLQKRCFCCKRRVKSMNLHHKTYKRLGAEREQDLVSLCPNCHLECHNRIKAEETTLQKSHWYVKQFFKEYQYINKLEKIGKPYKIRQPQILQILTTNNLLDNYEPTQLAKFEGFVYEHGETWIWNKNKIRELLKMHASSN